MKLTFALFLSALTMATTLMISPALQLGSDLTSSRLRTELVFDGPFLPINATLTNILQFMSIVARSDFEETLRPRMYYSSRYPQVLITSHSSTKARFLLCGIYYAAVDMIKFTRLNNVVINIFWDNNAVGQISLRVIDLLDPALNDTGSVMDDGGELSPEDLSNRTAQAFLERPRTPLAWNGTDNATIKGALVVNAVEEGDMALRNWSTSPARISDSPLSSRFAIRFTRIVGAHVLRRNNVYLAFYLAMLHVAKFPARSKLQHFTIPSSRANLVVNMYPTGAGCSVNFLPLLMRNLVVNMMKTVLISMVRSQYLEAITALTYVPVYMMEHPEFAYKETAFNVFLNGVRACKGSLLDNLESTGEYA